MTLDAAAAAGTWVVGHLIDPLVGAGWTITPQQLTDIQRCARVSRGVYAVMVCGDTARPTFILSVTGPLTDVTASDMDTLPDSARVAAITHIDPQEEAMAARICLDFDALDKPVSCIRAAAGSLSSVRSQVNGVVVGDDDLAEAGKTVAKALAHLKDAARSTYATAAALARCPADWVELISKQFQKLENQSASPITSSLVTGSATVSEGYRPNGAVAERAGITWSSAAHGVGGATYDLNRGLTAHMDHQSGRAITVYLALQRSVATHLDASGE